MKSKSVYPLVLALCLLAGACSTTLQPMPPRLPPAPLLEPPPALKKSETDDPQGALRVVVENYALYHQLVARMVALQAWVKGMAAP